MGAGNLDDKTRRGNRLWRFVPISTLVLVLFMVLLLSPTAYAASLNLNGSGPGIQGASMFPNNAMWVNTPTEYNIVPQAGGSGHIPSQVVSTKTSNGTVITPVYGDVAHQGQQWVSSGYWATGQYWVSSGYWATGQYWVSSGYWATGQYWVNSGYWQLHTWWAETGYWATGQTWVATGHWAWGETTIYGGYYSCGNNYVGGYGGQWGSGGSYINVCQWIPTVSYQWNRYWVSGGYWEPWSYWVSTAHWASDYHWISTAHWQSYSYWVNTSHWQSYQYWVNTSHWQSYQYWINTSHWQTYTYYVWQIVGYNTSVVSVVTTVTDRNIHLSNETLLGVQPEIENTTTGQIVDGSFCSTPTTPLIPPTSPSFPDYSGSPWEYANFFSGQDICNVNPGILPTTTFDQWAVAQQSVQLVLVPSWSATVSYNKVTTVNGSVTSSVPVTKTETITGSPYTSSAMPTRYLVGISCAVQNGQPYCPTSSGN
jgi:hypothetical protein